MLARRCVYALAPFTFLACALGSPANPQFDPPAAPATSLAERGAAFVAKEGCPRCHQSGDPKDGTLSGSDAAKGGKQAFPKNLTPDPETGIGMWTDDQLIGAIRLGTDDQAMSLCDVMPRFSDMSDDEAKAIVAYLRSLPAVKREIPDSQCDGPADDDASVPDASTGADAGAETAASADGPTTAIAAPPSAGEFVVSEVMFNPAGGEPDEEWFEIYNAANAPRLLSGLTVAASGGRTHVVAASPPVVAPAHGFVLFVRSRAAASAVNVPHAADAYEYGAGLTSSQGIILTNGTTGSIALSLGTTEIVSAPFGALALGANGASIQRKTLVPVTSSVASDWCVTHTAWSGGNGAGTPGEANDCP